MASLLYGILYRGRDSIFLYLCEGPILAKAFLTYSWFDESNQFCTQYDDNRQVDDRTINRGYHLGFTYAGDKI